jgi:PBSX family phage terminase large subunit
VEATAEILAHSQKQEMAFFSTKKITACITGIQWGKTTAGAVWMRNRIAENLESGASFIVTAPTFKIMEQSTLPAFMKEMFGFGKYNAQKAIFEIDMGLEFQNPRVYFRTSTEPDSVVGTTNVYGIWCDEAGKYPLYFWENIEGRSAFKNCPIIITTSPYSMNWIYKEIIRPTREGKRDDVLLIQASSNENPHFPQEVYERNKKIMDPRRFNMMYNGNFDRMQGLVYDCFEDNENQVAPFKLPEGTKYYGGIDWGYTEPFVLKVRAITLEGNHYSVSEFYKSGMTPTDIIALAKQKMEIFGIKQFYCDPSQPGLIEEFNRNKIPAVGADNDITRGIALHYELLAARKLRFFRGMNPYTLDELETYHYPEPKDLGPDDSAKDQKPVAQNDHALDADRYITISTYRMGKTLIPTVPEEKREKESDHQRIKRLMKRKRSNQTENWE